MKKLFYLILLSSVITTQAQTNAGREEITPFIVSTVLLKDTTLVKNMVAHGDGDLTLHEYNDTYRGSVHYLSSAQFYNFWHMMRAVTNSPKSRVYMDAEGTHMSSKEIHKHTIICDSIQAGFYDANGKEVQQKMWLCDSTSTFCNINRIDFYESWYFNKTNNMIEREVLGYAVWEYIQEKKAYRALFNVFKDEEGIKKAKKYFAY